MPPQHPFVDGLTNAERLNFTRLGAVGAFVSASVAMRDAHAPEALSDMIALSAAGLQAEEAALIESDDHVTPADVRLAALAVGGDADYYVDLTQTDASAFISAISPLFAEG